MSIAWRMCTGLQCKFHQLGRKNRGIWLTEVHRVQRHDRQSVRYDFPRKVRSSGDGVVLLGRDERTPYSDQTERRMAMRDVFAERGMRDGRASSG